jgi:hypothetical protein
MLVRGHWLKEKVRGLHQNIPSAQNFIANDRPLAGKKYPTLAEEKQKASQHDTLKLCFPLK